MIETGVLSQPWHIKPFSGARKPLRHKAFRVLPLAHTCHKTGENIPSIFFVGNHGAFDAMAWSVLSELRPIYSHIRFTTVLAYMPMHNSCLGKTYANMDTLLPEGIETVPRRYAIIWRNKWMLQQADYVVTYVVHHTGGAARFEEMAKRQGKTVICLTN